MVAKFFHLCAVVHFYFGLYYNFSVHSPLEIKNRKYEYGGQFVYFTILTFIIQTLYYTIALLNDFIGSNEKSPKERPLLRKVRDYIFSAFCFPLVTNVSGMFWMLYAIDRELVLPKSVDAFMPIWFNHVLHTNIMFFILIEMIILHHEYPSRRWGSFGILGFLFGYLIWTHVIYFNAGKWVYPVLAVFNWPQRTAFFTFTIVVPTLLYFLGEFLNDKICWRKSRLADKVGSGRTANEETKAE